MAQLDIRNCIFKISDGTPTTPLSITLKIGEGNLTYEEKKNREYIKDRGILDGVRNGEEEPLEVDFSLVWVFLRSNGAESVTPEEALKQVGGAVAWVTTDTDTCQPYAVDITVTRDLNCGTTYGEIVTLEDFRYESIQHDFRAGTLSVKGKCNRTDAVVIRSSI